MISFSMLHAFVMTAAEEIWRMWCVRWGAPSSGENNFIQSYPMYTWALHRRQSNEFQVKTTLFRASLQYVSPGT